MPDIGPVPGNASGDYDGFPRLRQQERPAEFSERLRDLRRLAERDPQAALASLAYFRDNDALPAALQMIAEAWAAHDPVAAAAWVETLGSGEEGLAALMGLATCWAAKDPQACLAWAEDLAPGPAREAALVHTADTWAERLPRQALERYLSMQEEQGVERGMFSIIAQWPHADVEGCLEYLSANSPGGRRDEFLETALVSLSNEDPLRAWKEAPRLGNPERVDHVRATALGAMAETHPQEAARIAAENGNPASWVGHVAFGWASTDPTAAAEWAEGLAEPLAAEAARSGLREAASRGSDATR